MKPRVERGCALGMRWVYIPQKKYKNFLIWIARVYIIFSGVDPIQILLTGDETIYNNEQIVQFWFTFNYDKS